MSVSLYHKICIIKLTKQNIKLVFYFFNNLNNTYYCLHIFLKIKIVFIYHGSLNQINNIFIHNFRMLPAYCAIMAIVAHILPHLGDGPLWPQKMWPEADNCKNYWWTNLLFISNFIDSKYQVSFNDIIIIVNLINLCQKLSNILNYLHGLHIIIYIPVSFNELVCIV